MSNNLPKWNEERTAKLSAFVQDESPVSQATVAEAAELLETSGRSISSKLRKMGFDVELASQAASKKSYTEDQEATLRALLESNSGQYNYAEIAALFEDGLFSAKSIQGKILSMELTGCVKPTEKAEVVKSYTDAEQATFVKMAIEGASVEALSTALGKSVQSIRGKALSLLRSGDIAAIPSTDSKKDTAKADPLSALTDIAEMTVEEIATAIEKTPRGVKTMLTRRGINVADYKGADRKEKTEAA